MTTNKKMSEMPWDNEDFVEAMRRSFFAGGFNARHCDWSKESDFQDFVKDAKRGYQD